MLVPPGDPAALANALSVVLTDGARRRRLTDAARVRVEEHYSEQLMIDAYEALYRGSTRPSTERQMLTASGQCAE
jgi:glycosyltransferase involved in cell wall biosynthesis